jgi:hypothetical protein
MLQTVRIWQQSEDGNYSCIRTLKDHTAEVSIKVCFYNDVHTLVSTFSLN